MARQNRKQRSNPPKSARRNTNGHDAASSLELTPQRKRDLLASVGFLDQDEDLPDVRLAGSFRSAAGGRNGGRDGRDGDATRDDCAEDDGRRTKNRSNVRNGCGLSDLDDCDDDDPYENDELVDGDDENYDDCSREELDGDSSRRSLINNLLTKIVWVLAITMAWMYVYSDDSKATSASAPGASTSHGQEQPFSYKGYKDGRIPDDDEAAPGWWLNNLEDEDMNGNNKNDDDETDDAAKSHSQSSFAIRETGLPGEESIWQHLSAYADTTHPYNPQARPHDIPFFWHIPKCGGTTLQDIMMHCFGMVGANEVGGAYTSDEELQIVQLENGNRYVNVDVTQPQGIEHAKNLGFGEANLADAVLSSRLYEGASLFTPDDAHPNVAKGRCFALLRHPIRRAVSMFFYLRDATWEHTYSEVYKSMTIEEYAVSQYAEENWMVRFLTNEMSGALTSQHLDLAKQILQTKCLIGIMEEFSASVKRFDRYFQWSQSAFEGGPVRFSDRGMCEARVIGAPDNAHEHPDYGEGTDVWSKLLEKNRLDLELYEHAVDLFRNVQVDLVEDDQEEASVDGLE